MKFKSAVGVLVVATACVAAIATSAAAQNTRPAEFASSDRTLNATYGALIRQLSTADQASLRAAQREWIKFRDADCAFGWAEQLDCMIQRTDEREKQLRDSVYFDRAGKLIALPTPQ